MVDHLLFDRLKWWKVADNADTISASGKEFLAIPKQIEISDNAHCLFLNDSNTSVAGFYPTIRTATTFDCVGVTSDAYIFTGKVSDDDGTTQNLYYDSGSRSIFVGLVPKSDVSKVIWGGKSLLNHWYNKACRLLKKEAVAC